MMFLVKIAATVFLLKVVDASLCQKIKCGSPLEKCIGNATHAQCVCKDGYYKVNTTLCEKVCDIHYCFHDGICEQGPRGKSCRCVSPYHGSRCENERTISIQIAVGSSIMAVVLIIFLSVVIWRNQRESAESSTKAKKPWDHEEFQKSPDSFHFGEEVTHPEAQVTNSDNDSRRTREDHRSDATSSCHETMVHITPAGNNSPKEKKEKSSLSNVYVNVAAEDEILNDKSEADNEEVKVEESGKESREEVTLVSNVIENAGADIAEEGSTESKL